MRSTKLLSLAWFLLVPAASYALPPCGEIAVAAGRAPEIQVANGYGDFVVRKSGRGVVVSHNGHRIDPEHIQLNGAIAKVQGDGGKTLLQVGVFKGFGGGQIAYTPDLDPSSVKSRFGLEVEPLGEDVAEHLEINPKNALAVSEVCDGPAASTLRAGDVIVAVEGKKPVTESALQKAGGTRKQGEALHLTILRAGSLKEVSIEAGPEKPWPTEETLESYLRQEVNE